MGLMVRKQIYIERRQEAKLKELALRTGQSQAEIIRQAIDRQMITAPTPQKHLACEAWEREKAFIQTLIDAGPVPATTHRWTREEIYKERLSRYGRERSG